MKNRKSGLVVNLALLCATVILTLTVLELGLRLYFYALGRDINHFRLRSDGIRYAPHPYLVYTFNPELSGVNSLGLVSREVGVKEVGVYRIISLGGSTTAEGYPQYLESFLKESFPSKKIEVINAGVSGWTSQESVINLVINLLDLEPDLLIIHQGVNDVSARCGPNFRGDYSHYRKVWVRGWLGNIIDKSVFLQDYSFLYRVVVFKVTSRRYAIDYFTETKEARNECSKQKKLEPETAKPFIRNTQIMVDLAKARGIDVLLSTEAYSKNPDIMENFNQTGLDIEEMNAITRELTVKNNLTLVDIEKQMTGDFDYFTDLVHMSEEGKKLKAKYFFTEILKGEFINSTVTA